MHKLLIFLALVSFSSCSTLILNQGLKEYKSEVKKSEEYRNANEYQKDLLYLNEYNNPVSG